MSDGISDANRGDECDHTLMVAICDDVEIVYWTCACGAVRWKPPEGTPAPSSQHKGNADG